MDGTGFKEGLSVPQTETVDDSVDGSLDILDPSQESPSDIMRQLEVTSEEAIAAANKRINQINKRISGIEASLRAPGLSEGEKDKLQVDLLWGKVDMAKKEGERSKKVVDQVNQFIKPRFESGKTLALDIPDSGFGRYEVESFDASTGEYQLKKDGASVKVDRLVVETSVSAKSLPVLENDYIPGSGRVYEVSGDNVRLSGKDESIPLKDVQREMARYLDTGLVAKQELTQAKAFEENLMNQIVERDKNNANKKIDEVRNRIDNIFKNAA